MKPEITISRAAPSDRTEILKLEKSCFSEDAFSGRQIAYLISRAKGVVYVARRGETAVGYLSFLSSRRSGAGRVYSLAVSPAYRGAGIAGLLLDKAIEYAVRKGLKAVFLEVRTDNIPAVSLYEKKGFVRRSVKRSYYADGTDACSMVLTLFAGDSD